MEIRKEISKTMHTRSKAKILYQAIRNLKDEEEILDVIEDVFSEITYSERNFVIKQLYKLHEKVTYQNNFFMGI